MSSPDTDAQDDTGAQRKNHPQTHPQKTQQQHIVLFYKYHPLSEDRNVMAEYQHALTTLCRSLRLTGRILVGCSRTGEGINGTLAGAHADVLAWTRALLGPRQQAEAQHEQPTNCDDDSNSSRNNRDAIRLFRKQSKAFFDRIAQPELCFDSPDDFKWSCCNTTRGEDLFPDLNIKLTSELIGTGGVLSFISLEETAQGYLTPREWHERLERWKNEDDDNRHKGSNGGGCGGDTILIDCRNTKEYEIGRFVGATNPNTTTFAQFPKWVDDHKFDLADKQVLMYCTGGIRCEKASAYIRKTVPSVKSVNHLKGGIHKYLEEYGGGTDGADDKLWKGRNFVFDGRGGATAEETRLGKDGRSASLNETCQKSGSTSHSSKNDVDNVVGRCVACEAPFDCFDARCVCTVCREPTLVCLECQRRLPEFHCRNHQHLRSCYFSDLHRYTYAEELEQQRKELQQLLDDIAVGRRFRQKRKTIQKQIGRVHARLDELYAASSGDGPDETNNEAGNASETTKCRNCGDLDCSGRCWGFFGLKRKEMLEKEKHAMEAASKTTSELAPTSLLYSQSNNPRKQFPALKKPRRDDVVAEIVQLNASLPPNRHRNPVTGVRVPPCCTRVLQCPTKAKWCGQSLLTVVQNEFLELSRPDVLRDVLTNGLLKLNGRTVSEWELSDRQLKSSDTIGRVLHWHEAPVEVPMRIAVEKVELPAMVIEALGPAVADADPFLYVCNKPSSVPVHPAGPYLANSLTLMVESQEGLPPQSLKPLHRTDRVTSGLTLCCTNSALSALFQKSLGEGCVDKLYLARVSGKFPVSAGETSSFLSSSSSSNNAKLVSKCSWLEEGTSVLVDAPVHTIDPAMGLRTVDIAGKESQSIFKRLAYDEESDTSLLSCFPVTGRNHQLRVHLQFLGFPIINDTQYGGRSETSSGSKAAVEDSPSVVELMVEAKNESDSSKERRVESLSDTDVAAAKRACPCCSREGAEGILQSFTPRQLLLEGHAIHLHALRYRIRLRPKKSKKTSKKKQDVSSLVEPPPAELDLAVDPPDWADREALRNLDWLKSSHG